MCVAKRRGAAQSSGVAEAEAEAIGRSTLEAMAKRGRKDCNYEPATALEISFV